MITTSHITHRYGLRETPALEEVTVDIRPGITGIIGPNGSGKTTLARILSGALEPASGTVSLDSHPLTRTERAALAFYCDAGFSLSSATAKQALLYARLRPTWSEEVFEHLATRFNLVRRGSLSRRSAGQLSLYATALALASGARLTILDEVTSHLDVPTRQALAEEIIELSAHGDRSFLLASHLVSELEAVVEDVIVLASGRIVMTRTSEEVRASVTALVGDESQIRALLDNAPVSPTVLSTRSIGRYAEVRVLDLSDSLASSCKNEGIDIRSLSFEDAFVSLINSEKLS